MRAEPLLDHPLPLRRSKREHIDAMGRLIARSGQNDWVVERVLDGLQLEVRECLRLDLNTPMDTVLDFLRRTDEVLAERLESLIATAPLNSRGRASQAAAVEWGRKSHAFLRDLYASRKAGAHS